MEKKKKKSKSILTTHPIPTMGVPVSQELHRHWRNPSRVLHTAEVSHWRCHEWDYNVDWATRGCRLDLQKCGLDFQLLKKSLTHWKNYAIHASTTVAV